jgi:hypothetical protein
MADPNKERERLADEAMGRDPDDAPSPDEPWAKTSSGNADEIVDDDNDD